MKLLVLFATVLAVQANRSHHVATKERIQDLLTGEFSIVQHDKMDTNELCATLRCHHSEVCLLKSGTALCVKQRYIQKYGRKHAPEFVKVIDEQEKKTGHLKHMKLRKVKKEKASTTPRFNPEKKQAECDKKALDAIGERMLLWFGKIHEEKRDHVGHVPKHNIPCDQEVGWMFTELDGDNDGVLSTRELRHIEDDPYEKCMKPFVDRCDQDADDDIDINEWCDCFTFVNKEEQEPLCHAEAHKVDPHDPETFSPKCDIEGFYRPAQCFKDECWCVDKWGREFHNSRSKTSHPDCGQYADDDEYEFDDDWSDEDENEDEN